MFQDLGLMGRGNFTTMPELFRRFALEGAAKNIELEIAKWSQYWNEEPGYPYGSELFYDNTGYESVFFYARAGGFNDLARRTVRVTLAGRGQAPCWFWNDSDQRWWDAVRTVPEYAQFTDFGENCHHYMTGLNGWMLLEAFESGMTDNSTRPAGFSGVLNSWARVHPDGFASMCYCPDPSSDNYGFNQFSGDVGLGLWGNLKAARCIVVDNPVLGRLVYGGKPIDDGDSPESVIQIQPMAGMRHRVRFMDPVLCVDSEGPEIKKIRWDTAAMKIDIDLENRFETACQAWITITGNLPDELECRFEDVRGRVEPKIDLRKDGGKWVIRKEIAPLTGLVCRLIPATGQDQ